ncbi:MAG: hypothetical protein EZS28_047649, partial [Streblomastix strix]
IEMYHKGLITHQIDESSLRVVTESELSEHKDPGNLWLAVNGIVYDVSNFKHRAGQKVLLNQGGTDCSGSFNRFHAYVNCANLPGVVTIGKYRPDPKTNKKLDPSMPSLYEGGEEEEERPKPGRSQHPPVIFDDHPPVKQDEQKH